jgi:hypothetical protein
LSWVKPNIRIARGQPTTVDIHVIHLPRGIKTPLSIYLEGHFRHDRDAYRPCREPAQA